MKITRPNFPGGPAALLVLVQLSLALTLGGTARAATPAPTTPEDFKYPGTQPGTITDPLATPSACTVCHSGYGSPDKEPWRTWQGSMVAQAGRDPLTYAAMAIANQDAPHSGELCIRCHMPKAWLEGRSTPVDASATTADDRQGVQCSVCHRLVDPDGSPGAPASDAAILAGLTAPVVTTGGGQMVVDPVDTVRGPFDIVADLGSDPHSPTRTALQAPFQESSQMCGTCHNVLNPVFQRNMSGGYDLGAFDAPGDPALAFPEQHTYTEWTLSSYAAGGVYGPQFAGNGFGVDGDYTVGSCQSCHMPRITGKAAWTGIERTNMPNHDLVGANTLVPLMIPLHPVFGAEVNAAVLEEGAAKSLRMLRRAATVGASIDSGVLTVRVTNETGHKLPTGYPDGRRMWLAVRAFDADGQVVYESGQFDNADSDIVGYEAAMLDPDYDPNLKVWETLQGIDPVVAMVTGQDAGPGFHLALNSVREFDNRIPPRGFTNAAFEAEDAEPVGAAFADGQYWEDVTYPVGTSAVRAEVLLQYQTTTKTYMEFLRDENTTTSDGDIAYNLWEQAGEGLPVDMARVVVDTDVKRVNGCRTSVSKLQSKYLKTFLKQWGRCYADSAAGETCDTGAAGTGAAEAAAALREKLGGASDKKCEGAGLTPASIGLGSYCPAPCASVVLFDMDDVADCAVCQADAVASAALESAYGVVPPALPAAVVGSAPAACQKKLGNAATTLANKWAAALHACEKSNASGKTTPAVDCSTDPKGKIASAQDSAAGKVDKCTDFTVIEGCAAGALDNAALYQCIEDALGATVPASVSVAYP
ncbi:MAG: multiheme c-type cytochrome [Candidatus Binatia bacterium]